MLPAVLATMVTTTTYGSWLAGDLRGYIQNGLLLPEDPHTLQKSKSLLLKNPILLTLAQRNILSTAIQSAAKEFHYALTDVSVESWHLHWLVNHGFDAVEVMVGRLKNRMRQSLNIGRIWTEEYCHRCLRTDDEVQIARKYIARHDGCRLTGGHPR